MGKPSEEEEPRKLHDRDQAHAGRRIEIVRVLSSINPVYGQLILGVTPLCASVVRLPFGKFTPRREE